MTEPALFQTRIDPEIRDQAAAVLANIGLTVSDAVPILLTRTAHEGALPIELVTNSETHDSCFSRQSEALDDKSPTFLLEESKHTSPSGETRRGNGRLTGA